MENIDSLKQAWESSPHPSTKISNYFSIYSELFKEYQNTNCTFIETGILGGGSLFMWRRWLGNKARIIGIDMNPAAQKWKNFGFEIFIGDQGDEKFWKRTLADIGQFDVLLDDGGHQSFQQIVTTREAIKFANKKCVIAVEDTHASFMQDFAKHGEYTFHRYAEDSTKALTARNNILYPNRFLEVRNTEIVNQYKKIHSIQFFSSIVAFKINPELQTDPAVIWNKREIVPDDFRYNGINSAETLWPTPFEIKHVNVLGGKIN